MNIRIIDDTSEKAAQDLRDFHFTSMGNNHSQATCGVSSKIKVIEHANPYFPCVYSAIDKAPRDINFKETNIVKECDFKGIDEVQEIESIIELQNALELLEDYNFRMILDIIERSELSVWSIARNILHFAGIRPYKSRLYYNLITNCSKSTEILKSMHSQLNLGQKSGAYRFLNLCFPNEYQATSDIPIIKFLKTESIEEIEEYLNESNENLEKVYNIDKYECTPIEIAVFLGSMVCFKHLLSKGAKITDRTMKHAISGGNIDIIKTLASMGLEINDNCLKASIIAHQTNIFNWVSKRYQHPLDYEVFTLCIEYEFYNGISTFSGINADKASRLACSNNCIEIVRYIQKNAKFEESYLLCKAAIEGNLDYIKSVSNLGEIINQTTSSITKTRTDFILLEACRRGRTEIVKYLLTFPELDINQKTKKIESDDKCGLWRWEEEETFPLLEAVTFGHLDIIKLLLNDARTNINEETSKTKNTAMIEACTRENIKIAKYLLTNQSLDINHVGYRNVDQNQPTFALLEAVKSGSSRLVALLLANPKTNVNVITKFNQFALLEAVIRNQTEIVRQLLKFPDTKVSLIGQKTEENYPTCPLFEAIKNENIIIIDLLLEMNCIDPNITISETPHITPLIESIRHDNALEMIKIQLKHPNIDINKKCCDNYALLEACHNQKYDIAEFLLKQKEMLIKKNDYKELMKLDIPKSIKNKIKRKTTK